MCWEYMNKPTLIISILILSVGVMAGCENQETPASSPQDKIPATTESAGSDQATVMYSLDEIKWDEVKDPLIEDIMISKLKAAIAAFVSNDVNQFHAALSLTVGTGHDYLLEHPVKFTGIDNAHKERDFIIIPVVGERLENKEGFSENERYHFYFEQDKEGIWQIVSID